MNSLIKLLLRTTAFVLISYLSAKPITVVIASESEHKIAAVRAAFQRKFPEQAIAYTPCKAASLVADQPIGFEQAHTGAQNRLRTIPAELSAQADYLVAIENYIEQSASTGSWYDKGLVIMQDMSTAYQVSAITQSTYIPVQFVQMAQEWSCTVGQAIQKVFNNGTVNPQDWHRELLFGGVSRMRLLEDALFKALHHEELALIKSHVVLHNDFPKPGIIFADFLPILQHAQTFQLCIDLLYERYKSASLTAIVGLESRGFIIGAALAYKLGIAFVPVRKPGKLPCAVHSVTYQKEYGTDILTIGQTALGQEDRVLIVDDLIATGGSARAAIQLVGLTGAVPVEFVSILRVAALEEAAKLNIPAFNLID